MGNALTIIIEQVDQKIPPPYGAVLLKNGSREVMMARRAYEDKLGGAPEPTRLEKSA